MRLNAYGYRYVRKQFNATIKSYKLTSLGIENNRRRILFSELITFRRRRSRSYLIFFRFCSPLFTR